MRRFRQGPLGGKFRKSLAMAPDVGHHNRQPSSPRDMEMLPSVVRLRYSDVQCIWYDGDTY